LTSSSKERWEDDGGAVKAVPAHVITGAVLVDARKIAAIALIIAGVLGLAYGGFSYTKETHETKIGPIELSVKDTQRVNIPVWAGAGALIAGVLLLVVRTKG
jgi:multidrug transporter EmrE-like cation transporter